jgi:hypothetical protein
VRDIISKSVMKTAIVTASLPFARQIGGLLKAFIMLLALSGMGIAGQKSRDFFAPDGIVIGSPEVTAEGAFRVPITFRTAITHSSQWIDTVKVSVDRKSILITANFTTAGRKSRYPGYIELKGLSSGEHEIKCRDPDGKLHPLGKVTVP